MEIKSDKPESNDELHGDALFTRLLELKEKYRKLRRELGLPVSWTTSYTTEVENDLAEGDPSEESAEDETEKIEEEPKEKEEPKEEEMQEDEEEEFKEEEDDSKDNEEFEIKKTPTSNGSRRLKLANGASTQDIQALITQIIIPHGGSCHFETIVEQMRQKWQKENVTKSDGTPFTYADCKKIAQTNLKTKPNSRLLFSKDKDIEGHWVVNTMKNDEKDETKPLSACISNSIEEGGGCVHIEDIFDYVWKNWKRKSISEGKDLTKDEVESRIQITLKTNPKFQEDAEQVDHYIVTSKKRKYHRKEETKKRKSDNDDVEGGSNRASLHRSAKRLDSAPTEGYSCPRCGTTEPGKGPHSKWKRGPSGEFLCSSCILQKKKGHLCPICGQAYRSTDADNSWIRCDDCHRWVMTKCDNIDDLSIYDDSNPDHLHYSCPICRGELDSHQDLSAQPKVNGNGRLKTRSSF